MKIYLSTLLMLLPHLCWAGGEPILSDRKLKQYIDKAQCVLLGKLEVIDLRFMDEDGQIQKGKIIKAFQKGCFQ